MKNIISLLLIVVLFSCGDSTYVPKQKGFNFIDLPSHEYVKFVPENDPFTFEVSKDALVKNDTVIYEGASKEHYKIITYPKYNAQIHLTYKKITSKDTLDSYTNESYRLAYGHDVKAYGITSKELEQSKGHYSTVIKLQGDVPSPYQFYTHDSTSHFIRGALYFPTAVKNDSLSPVIEYVIEDIHHLLKTLDWK